jgi:hypothetical protein
MLLSQFAPQKSVYSWNLRATFEQASVSWSFTNPFQDEIIMEIQTKHLGLLLLSPDKVLILPHPNTSAQCWFYAGMTAHE